MRTGSSLKAMLLVLAGIAAIVPMTTAALTLDVRPLPFSFAVPHIAVSVEITPHEDDELFNITVGGYIDYKHKIQKFLKYGKFNLTGYHAFTEYNITARAYNTTNEESGTVSFTTGLGRPVSRLNVTKVSSTSSTVTIKITVVDPEWLNGPPTGYMVSYCNVTCSTDNTTSPLHTISGLKPDTLYDITAWAYNVDEFGVFIENKGQNAKMVLSAEDAIPLGGTPAGWIVAGVLLSLVVAAVVGIVVHRRRRRGSGRGLQSVSERDLF